MLVNRVDKCLIEDQIRARDLLRDWASGSPLNNNPLANLFILGRRANTGSGHQNGHNKLAS